MSSELSYPLFPTRSESSSSDEEDITIAQLQKPTSRRGVKPSKDSKKLQYELLIKALAALWLLTLVGFLSFIFADVFKSSNPSKSGKVYTAAAIQYERADTSTIPDGVPEWKFNVDQYSVYIERAQAAFPGVELVVFPEGANGWFPNPVVSIANIAEYADSIPKVSNGSPFFNPCASSVDGQLRQLSCLAKTYNVALVANIIEVRSCADPSLYEVGDPPCPSNGLFFFNAAVAFASSGQLLAKYYKRHISGELGIINQPLPTRLPVYFDLQLKRGTNRFGIMICNDISYVDQVDEYLAMGIRDIVFPTHFANALPMWRMGLSFQGYSKSLGVNFIVANGASGSSSTQGGGIFSQGVIKSYFWDPSPTAPTRAVTASDSVPFLSGPPSLRPPSFSITPSGPTSLPPAADCISATSLAAYGITGRCVLLPSEGSAGETVAVEQPAITGSFRCEADYVFGTKEGGTADKFALINLVFPQSPAMECEGIDFRICMIMYCPDFPNCGARDGFPAPSTPLNAFQLTGRGFNEWKTSPLPSVAGIDGFPVLGAWDVQESQYRDILRIRSSKDWTSGDGVVDTITLTGTSPFQNICWNNDFVARR